MYGEVEHARPHQALEAEPVDVRRTARLERHHPDPGGGGDHRRTPDW
jgi:hypothetical protein